LPAEVGLSVGLKHSGHVTAATRRTVVLALSALIGDPSAPSQSGGSAHNSIARSRTMTNGPVTSGMSMLAQGSATVPPGYNAVAPCLDRVFGERLIEAGEQLRR